MLAISGRVIMVSGASRGIGAAVCARLLEAGFKVSGGMRSPETALTHPNFFPCTYDAGSLEAASGWVQATVQHFGRIDAVVNIAGINPRVTVEHGDEEKLDQMWRVNVKGPLRLVRAALPHLKSSGTGRVINLASLAGKRVGTNVGYAMTKFALVALTHGIRQEFWNDGIRACAVCPGYVATDMTAHETEVAAPDMTQPEDLAEIVETVLRLPNSASLSEILVNCRKEGML
ncbi:SDR family NAD(P)-dependent oxidoreductase [Gluconobacter frateurii]|uniref:Dehydrogenase n=1 Tax=Gluconobacter frateurii NRIC 0228 TaxID=1307946 RepID=A0ABQ0QAS8_9PROT|nr:SDR family NAD(P)-dependent oxidoreductase [Gluconobacter frateurii]GBR11283.1 dehydrogenase [Gluconobacter frateurii NRIC 0228]GLP89054.1 agropine synthesis reductase [Gluconobacter frateurii]